KILPRPNQLSHPSPPQALRKPLDYRDSASAASSALTAQNPQWGNQTWQYLAARHRTLVTTVVKTFSNLLNSTHHPFAGARCSADSGGSADSTFEQ
ncbi:hypothetical protein CEP51_015934, partial [Fusarium floridanum]